MFKLEIKTGGAAYRDIEGECLDPASCELIRNLKEVIKVLERGSGNYDGVIMDINGNKVGSWSLED